MEFFKQALLYRHLYALVCLQAGRDYECMQYEMRKHKYAKLWFEKGGRDLVVDVS